MTAIVRRATAGMIAVLAGCALAPAASAQVVPALDAPDPGTTAKANASAKPNGNTAAANASSTGVGDATGNASATPNGSSARADATTPTGADTSVGGGGSRGPNTMLIGVPAHFPPPVPTVSPERTLAPRERRNVAMATKWRARPARPRMDADGVLHFAHGDGEPTVVCAPYRVCDISLEPGESITDKPDIGDPRWITHPRISGTGAGRTLHVIVKPSDAGIDANMVVQTDRRTVSVRLVSRANDYMPFVKLDGPPDGAAGGEAGDTTWASVIGAGTTAAARTSVAATPCDTPPVVPPDAYRIGRGNVAWRPTQAYAVSTPVGMKTCIDLPAHISSMDVPVLVTLDSSGAEQVVSYRQQGRRLLVDRLIDRAVLVAGVGGSQDSITIDRRGYR